MMHTRLIGLAGALLAGVLSCSRVTPEAAPAPATEAPAPNVRLVPRRTLDTTAWVDSVFTSLSPRERVAQMVTFWVLGDYTAADDSALAASVIAARAGAGGFTMSLGTPIEAATKINYLQRHAKVPMFVSSDLEPSLMRLEAGVFPHYMIETGGATSFPTAMAIAATGRDEDAFSVAQAIAQEARAVGIHINFAPTVDVNINPNNPVIATRSFGEDPQHVARLATQFVRGTRDGGLLATAKHFPGHGDTDVDSHVGLPVVTASSARLSSVELVPFRAAINAGAELVMSAHIALPALGGDSTTPATLREDVMTGLLRDSLGFKGLAITDALTMQGIGKGYTIEESVVQAVRAGTDILLRPGDDVNAAIDAVLGGIERGRITQARIDASVKRILLHKARAGLANGRYVDIDSLRLVVATKPHLDLALDVAQRAITLVRDTASTVPIRTQRVMVVQYMPETEIKAGRAFNREMNRLRPGTRMVGKISPTTGQAYLDSIAARLDRADAIVLATFVRRVEGEGRTTVPPHISAWIDSVGASPKAVVVSFGNPYLIRQFPRAMAYMNTYGVGDALEVAAARALFGAAPIGGKSPVSLPGFFKRGDGLTR